MKKQLLNESDVRKMMKFANLGPLSDGFVQKLNETGMTYDDDDPMEEAVEDDDPDDLGGGVESGGMTDPSGTESGGMSEPEVSPEEVGVDTEVGMTGPEGTTEPVDVDPEVVKAAVMKIIDKLQKVVDVEYGEGAPELEATTGEPEPEGEELGGMTMDTGEEAGGMSMPTEPDVGAGMTSPDAPMSVGAPEDDELEEEFINEMTRRVAARLVKATRRRK